MSTQNTMDEAFGTPPRMRRAGGGGPGGQGSFRSSTPYTPFGGGGGLDHYGSLGRGAAR